jgi:hypothetical protein
MSTEVRASNEEPVYKLEIEPKCNPPILPNPPKSDPIFQETYDGTMEIYDLFKWPETVPKIKWSDLTAEQQFTVLEAYRFSGFKPGTYQGVTGVFPDGKFPS